MAVGRLATCEQYCSPCHRPDVESGLFQATAMAVVVDWNPSRHCNYIAFESLRQRFAITVAEALEVTAVRSMLR